MSELELKLANLACGRPVEFAAQFMELIPNIVGLFDELKAQQAAVPSVPEGFVPAPIIPTLDMIEVGMDEFVFPLDNGSFGNSDLACAYRAMIEKAQENGREA